MVGRGREGAEEEQEGQGTWGARSTVLGGVGERADHLMMGDGKDSRDEREARWVDQVRGKRDLTLQHPQARKQRADYQPCRACEAACGRRGCRHVGWPEITPKYRHVCFFVGVVEVAPGVCVARLCSMYALRLRRRPWQTRQIEGELEKKKCRILPCDVGDGIGAWMVPWAGWLAAGRAKVIRVGT